MRVYKSLFKECESGCSCQEDIISEAEPADVKNTSNVNKNCDDRSKQSGNKYANRGGSCKLVGCGSGKVWNDDRDKCIKKEGRKYYKVNSSMLFDKKGLY